MENVKVLGQDAGEKWHIYHGDCVEVARGIPEGSIDFIVFSPPFESLYTYSNSARDMGNCRKSLRATSVSWQRSFTESSRRAGA